MQKFAEFQKNYNDALETINTFLNPYHPMQKLVRWMMETDANPYSYLPKNYASMTFSAEGFAGILRSIHHNLYDDGDVTIVKTNGEPRITFVWKHENNFNDLVLSGLGLSKTEKENSNIQVEILDINPIDFGDVYDEWYREQIKSWFLNDAEWQSVEFAVKYYSKYKFFDHSWINEVGKN